MIQHGPVQPQHKLQKLYKQLEHVGQSRPTNTIVLVLMLPGAPVLLVLQVVDRSPARQDHDATLGSSRANKLVPHRDPVAGEDVLASNDTGATYVIPPQTLEGQQARQQIAFGHTDPNQQHHQQHLDGQDHHDKPKEHKRAHFSDYLHINDHRERRYVESDGIADWQHAQIATLTAADLDLNIKRGDNTRLDWDQRNASQGQGSTQHTTFNPPLLLKCGPLLRYTGIDAGTDAAKKYWRGTVMIVTEDHSSSYQHPPTLRLFKQPGELVPAADAAEARYSDEVDHVAGQIKLGRRGQTLYVRPVHELRHEADLSRVEDDTGLFETIVHNHSAAARVATIDGEKVRQYQDVQGHRLHAERGVTFWRFMLEVELTEEQQRIAYRINEGAPVAFWVPSKHQMMNIMFHSCNGFSHSVKSDLWCGPDPLWRDVMRQHQTKPFHCMIGGGDQIYMDACMKETVLFKEWCEDKGESKHKASLTSEMQDELEQFYLDRYSMWFSTGMFGLANSQIPMVNVWDDHDIIDVRIACPAYTGIVLTIDRASDHIPIISKVQQYLLVSAPLLTSTTCFFNNKVYQTRLQSMSHLGCWATIRGRISISCREVYSCL
jgi:hypothetical protein